MLQGRDAYSLDLGPESRSIAAHLFRSRKQAKSFAGASGVCHAGVADCRTLHLGAISAGAMVLDLACSEYPSWDTVLPLSPSYWVAVEYKLLDKFRAMWTTKAADWEGDAGVLQLYAAVIRDSVLMLEASRPENLSTATLLKQTQQHQPGLRQMPFEFLGYNSGMFRVVEEVKVKVDAGSYGLHSYGLCSYGLYSYAVMAYIVTPSHSQSGRRHRRLPRSTESCLAACDARPPGR